MTLASMLPLARRAQTAGHVQCVKRLFFTQ